MARSRDARGRAESRRHRHALRVDQSVRAGGGCDPHRGPRAGKQEQDVPGRHGGGVHLPAFRRQPPNRDRGWGHHAVFVPRGGRALGRRRVGPGALRGAQQCAAGPRPLGVAPVQHGASRRLRSLLRGSPGGLPQARQGRAGRPGRGRGSLRGPPLHERAVVLRLLAPGSRLWLGVEAGLLRILGPLRERLLVLVLDRLGMGLLRPVGLGAVSLWPVGLRRRYRLVLDPGAHLERGLGQLRGRSVPHRLVPAELLQPPRVPGRDHRQRRQRQRDAPAAARLALRSRRPVHQPARAALRGARRSTAARHRRRDHVAPATLRPARGGRQTRARHPLRGNGPPDAGSFADRRRSRQQAAAVPLRGKSRARSPRPAGCAGC